jgi:transposase
MGSMKKRFGEHEPSHGFPDLFRVGSCARSLSAYSYCVAVVACEKCGRKDREILALRARNEELLVALRELDKLCRLQSADLDRVKKQRDKLEPNRSERIAGGELQLAFEQFIEALGAPANDAQDEEASSPEASPEITPTPASGAATGRGKKKGHGRRDLDVAKLPVQEVIVKPPEVLADPDKYREVGEDSSYRVAFRRAAYIRIRLVRLKYKLIGALDVEDGDGVPMGASTTSQKILCADIPGYFWPRAMADVSAITQVILSKYDLCLPLHRQERVSERSGFHLPRSTQCDWLSAAHGYTYRIVDAMMAEARRTAFCIATDATSAPMRMPGECANWHLFVFIADLDHIIFRPTRVHSGAAITEMLDGFEGHLLSDASAIYDTLHRDQGLVEVCCWFHLRRYVWRSRATEPALAMQALAIIAKLFEVDRATRSLPMPERTDARARLAGPLLDLFDRWVAHAQPSADEKSPLASALTYYENQRDGLREFLSDGRLRLDNNLCEQQLRHLVVGLHNWNLFENEAGLEWYAVFRSLIASCKLHELEAQDYLDEVLRLAPHWPVTRMIELSPKYWAATRASLSPEQQEIITPPWMSADFKSVTVRSSVAA